MVEWDGRVGRYSGKVEWEGRAEKVEWEGRAGKAELEGRVGR